MSVGLTITFCCCVRNHTQGITINTAHHKRAQLRTLMHEGHYHVTYTWCKYLQTCREGRSPAPSYGMLPLKHATPRNGSAHYRIGAHWATAWPKQWALYSCIVGCMLFYEEEVMLECCKQNGRLFGFTTYGEQGKLVENSEHRLRSFCKMTRSSTFTSEWRKINCRIELLTIVEPKLVKKNVCVWEDQFLLFND